MSYNGWTNKETWLVNLWLGDYIQESLAESDCRDKYDAAAWIRDLVEEFCDSLNGNSVESGFLVDIFNCAFGEINWRELAEFYLAEIESEANA